MRAGVATIFAAVSSGWRHLRAHGATVQRARVLCFAADLLEVRRPRGWKARGERLYRRAARDLGRVAALAATPAMAVAVDAEGVVAPSDPAPRARALLRSVEAPVRRAALVIAGMAASLLAATTLLVLLGCWVSPSLRGRLFPPDLAAHAPWIASSTIGPNPLHGIGPSSAPHEGLFFHTQPSDHPWIEIDLRARRVIRSIEVENRADCCAERGMPLNFEVFDDATRDWRVVVQRRAGFTTWKRSFPPVQARRVRLRLASSGLLHLRRISVYEW